MSNLVDNRYPKDVTSLHESYYLGADSDMTNPNEIIASLEERIAKAKDFIESAERTVSFLRSNDESTTSPVLPLAVSGVTATGRVRQGEAILRIKRAMADSQKTDTNGWSVDTIAKYLDMQPLSIRRAIAVMEDQGLVVETTGKVKGRRYVMSVSEASLASTTPGTALESATGVVITPETSSEIKEETIHVAFS